MDFYENLLDDEKEVEKTPIPGVTTGVVTSNWDEEHPGMVQVQLFLAEEGENLTGWMRVARPYAGNGYGVYMLPEVGDEVLIAFNMGDPDQPYVIGSLWNSSVDLIPEETAVEANTIKRIRTAGGHEILFDEEEGKENIKITTTAQLTVKLEDEKKLITIQDADGANLITVDGENGAITLTSAKKIVLDAGGKAKLTLDGEGNSAKLEAETINVEASQNATLKGQNATVDAGTALKVKSGGNGEVKAGGNLDLKGSGITTVKGSMVQIN